MALKDTMAMIAQFQQMDNMQKQQAIREQQLAMEQQRFAQGQQEFAYQQQQRQQAQQEYESLLSAQRNGTNNTYAQLVGGQGAFDPNNPEDQALIRQEPEFMPAVLQNQMAESIVAPGGIKQTSDLQSLQKSLNKDNSSEVFGQQLRGMGTDLLFLAHTYGDGKIPTSVKELEDQTKKAAADPAYGDKRTEWSNNRTAGKYQFVGTASDDPTQVIIQDPKKGTQSRVTSAGDALNQTLTNATADETSSLAVYRDLYGVADELGNLFDETLVGPFEGNMNRMASMFVNTPEYSKFKSVADRLRTIVYGFSGKQINETELEWLTGILPQVYNPDENFKIKLNSLQEWLVDKQDAQLMEMRSARRYTGAKSLRDGPVGVSEERFNKFKETLDKKLGAPKAGQAPIVIDLRTNKGGS